MAGWKTGPGPKFKKSILFEFCLEFGFLANIGNLYKGIYKEF
jgi:hypothetical protein